MSHGQIKMATAGTSKDGEEFSHPEGRLCLVHDLGLEDNLIGIWEDGIGGHIDIMFPRESTRDLTPSELAAYNAKLTRWSNRLALGALELQSTI